GTTNAVAKPAYLSRSSRHRPTRNAIPNANDTRPICSDLSLDPLPTRGSCRGLSVDGNVDGDVELSPSHSPGGPANVPPHDAANSSKSLPDVALTYSESQAGLSPDAHACARGYSGSVGSRSLSDTDACSVNADRLNVVCAGGEGTGAAEYASVPAASPIIHNHSTTSATPTKIVLPRVSGAIQHNPRPTIVRIRNGRMSANRCAWGRIHHPSAAGTPTTTS